MEIVDQLQDGAVQQVAARLANTSQVIQAWASALTGDRRALGQRLLRAARELDTAVATLTEEGDGAGWSPGEERGVVSSTAGGLFGLRGRSEMISLVEFIAFVASLQRDGVLEVEASNENFVIELRDGEVVFVTGDRPPKGERLGEILVSLGLPPASVARAMVGAREGELIGAALVRQGMIGEEDLRTALQFQALRVFCRMHKAGAGFSFKFEENQRVMDEPDVRLVVSHLLLESARVLDEQRLRGEEPAAAAEPAERPVPAPRKAQRPASGARPASGTRPAPARSREPRPANAPHDTLADLDVFRHELERAIEAGDLALPVLPSATGQLMAMCWSNEFDAEKLVEHVSRDQALCAHLLRVANSVLYAAVEPISSVQLAITRVGLDKLREITMALTLKQKVFELSGWEHVVKALWRHSAVTSGLGNLIGKRVGVGSVRGGMVGLLQDIGKPVVLNALHEIQKRIGKRLTGAVAERLMEDYHPHLGAVLAKQWKLPDWLAEVMRCHHDYAAAEEHVVEVMIANLADALACCLEAGGEANVDELEGHPVCAELKLGVDDVRAVLSQAERIKKMAEVY